jgi:hypothetical protein
MVGVNGDFTYIVPVGPVIVVVVGAGIRRYALQKVVATGPRTLRTDKAELTALQFTARSSRTPAVGCRVA